MSENNAGIQLDSQTLYLRQKRLGESGLVAPGPDLVAAGISAPENIGMLLRVADAGGARRVVLLNDALPKLERIRKTARSADALVEWKIEPLQQFPTLLGDLQAPLIAVELTTTSTNLFETALPPSCTLVLGGERHGIPKEILRECRYAVHIPMFGTNGSINVTHAAAVALFEWRRQHPAA